MTTPYWTEDTDHLDSLPEGTAAVTPNSDRAYIKGSIPDGWWHETGYECDTPHPDLPTLIVHIPEESHVPETQYALRIPNPGVPYRSTAFLPLPAHIGLAAARSYLEVCGPGAVLLTREVPDWTEVTE